MNNRTCLFCNSPLQPHTGRGKPPTFCSNAHRVAFNRAQKSSSPPSQPAAPSILQRLPELAASARAKATVSTVPANLLPYMPTTNDANILALLNHRGPTRDLPLPFPNGGAHPICTLPSYSPTPPPPAHVYDDKPTF